MVSTGICRPDKNILLIRRKAIGDVIFTLPAADVLRDRPPILARG